jgi:tetratricopeptide (TPR) repeat protein
MVSKAAHTAGNPEGDVMWGVDNTLLSRALAAEVFDPYASKELAAIDRDSPMYVKARTFAAYVYRQQDDLDGALESVDQALEAEPQNLNLTLYGVLISRDMGNFKEAEKKLRRALEAHPNDERVQFNLAVVLHERGDEAEALKLMERIVEVNPKNSDALNFVAYAHAESGSDLKRAEELVRRALEIKSGDGYYLDTLGFVQFKKGDLKLAEETLSRAVASTGQDPVIIEHYVEVLLAQGKEREVVGLLKSISDLELLGEDLRDKDKVSALRRLKEKLQMLLKDHPELSGVDRSRILKPSPPQSVSLALPGLELLDDYGDELEISEVTR